jgi:hypothetical protein
MIAALAAIVAANSPAVLVVYTPAHGYQFASFSTLAACERTREILEADADRRTRLSLGIADPKRPIPQPILGTGTLMRCLLG